MEGKEPQNPPSPTSASNDDHAATMWTLDCPAIDLLDPAGNQGIGRYLQAVPKDLVTLNVQVQQATGISKGTLTTWVMRRASQAAPEERSGGQKNGLVRDARDEILVDEQVPHTRMWPGLGRHGGGLDRRRSRVADRWETQLRRSTASDGFARF